VARDRIRAVALERQYGDLYAASLRGPADSGRAAQLAVPWTEIGAARVTVVQGLLATWTLQGVDRYAYLVDVLQCVGRRPASRAVEPTPRVWRTLFADDPLRSCLDHGRGSGLDASRSRQARSLHASMRFRGPSRRRSTEDRICVSLAGTPVGRAWCYRLRGNGDIALRCRGLPGDRHPRAPMLLRASNRGVVTGPGTGSSQAIKILQSA